MTHRLVAMTLVIALFASGCIPPWADEAITEAAAAALGGHVVELREAIKADSATAAQDILNELRRDARLRATAGDITGKRLARIEAAADEVERFLSQLEPEPDVAPALTPQAPPHPKPTPQLTVPPSPRGTPTPPVAPSANPTPVPSPAPSATPPTAPTPPRATPTPPADGADHQDEGRDAGDTDSG